MTNITCFMTALKSTWIRKIFKSESKWASILFSKLDKEVLMQWA